MISLIQNLIKHVFINFRTLENIQSKFRKSCQKSANSSAKMPILKLFLLLLKLITIFQLKIKHPFLVYKFVCARCNSCYIGETCRHFKNRIDEHMKKDKKSNIYKHLNNNEECFSSFNSDCFLFYITAQHSFRLRLKKVCILIGRSQNLTNNLTT